MTETHALLLILYVLALLASVVIWRRGGVYGRRGELAFYVLATGGVALLLRTWWRAGDDDPPAPPPHTLRPRPLPTVRPVEIEALDRLAADTNRRIEEIDDEINDAHEGAGGPAGGPDAPRFAEHLRRLRERP